MLVCVRIIIACLVITGNIQPWPQPRLDGVVDRAAG